MCNCHVELNLLFTYLLTYLPTYTVTVGFSRTMEPPPFELLHAYTFCICQYIRMHSMTKVKVKV